MWTGLVFFVTLLLTELSVARGQGHAAPQEHQKIAFMLPPMPLQQFPGPGDTGHNSPYAQPQCRAFWNKDAGIVCTINLMWLTSWYYQPTSLFGRFMLYCGAHQMFCDRHTNFSTCVADRQHYCSPVSSPTIGFDCVPFSSQELTYEFMVSKGGAFCCPGSMCDTMARCFSLSSLRASNEHLDVTDAKSLCKQYGCEYDRYEDRCFLFHKTWPLANKTTMGECPSAHWWIKQVQQAKASRSYSTCPYQTGAYDAVMGTCNIDIIQARAVAADDLSTFAQQVDTGTCSRGGYSVSKCEDYGNWTQWGSTDVIDPSLLDQYLQFNVTDLNDSRSWRPLPQPMLFLACAIIGLAAAWLW